ncbi:MAG TPA: hypothetical protein VG166_01490 [Caulobacteraceae bacterium]|jgi:hypothetical protein|nr:hypothetical protein [Caulobacteraceae bacterium]
MRIKSLMFAGAAALVIAGCADYGVGVYGPGPGPYYGPTADLEYDGYYDGYYGPIYDGYWNSGAFFYRTGDSDAWHRGDTTHFRREPAPGFNHIHGMAHASPRPERRAPPPG